MDNYKYVRANQDGKDFYLPDLEIVVTILMEVHDFDLRAAEVARDKFVAFMKRAGYEPDFSI